MNFTEASLTRLAVHYTGNRHNGQSLLLSKQEQELDSDSRQKISDALLGRFQQCHERYAFHHSSDLKYNEMYGFVSDLFSDPKIFFDESVKMVSHLFEVSMHPRIKPGELYITFFTNILIEEKAVDAIGLFKAETRSLFADIEPGMDDITMQLKEGVELSKIDKGCLILNQEKEQGFELLIFDSNGKGEEALYWKDKFLAVMIRQNEFLHTQGFLTITKNFVTNHLPGEFEVSKTEQIDLLNRSMDYFKTHGSFDKEEFETEVLHHDNIIDSFRKYDDHYRQKNELAPAGSFDISPQAVKKQARVFKNVIKLDKNFHIYIHGDRDLIEKGYDDGLQKHFYKIYFDHEMM